MKKLAVLLLIILSALCLFVFAACEAEQPAESGARTQSSAEKPSEEQSSAGDNQQSTIINNDAAVLLSANGFTDDGDGNYRIILPNETEIYSFINQITVSENATWVISLDVYGMNTVLSKTIPVEIGDNVVYLIVISGDGETVAFYTMTVRRRPLYTVTFNTNGGTAVNSQTVEEDHCATEPATQKAGYTFVNWNFDLTSPIVENKIISAVWQANNDTPYKVEYYLENVYDTNYTLTETVNLTGTTDTTAYAEIKTYEHFTPTANSVSGNIAGSGTAVLKVYYTRNKYSFSAANGNSKGGNVSCTTNGQYKYQTEITLTATVNAGYDFIGWYEKNNELTKNASYSFELTANCNIVAEYYARTDTPYKVEYYFENLEDNNYTLTETVNLTGTTDTTAYAEIKTYEHFTPTANSVSGNIAGNGTSILKVYYSRNKYSFSAANGNSEGGNVSCTINGQYKYQTEITLTATVNDGYDFIGWYEENDELTKNASYSFELTANCNIVAEYYARTDTPYKVEYYLENVYDTNYTLTETVNLTGTTDTTAYAEIKAFEHFTPTKNTVSGNIAGNGDSVLKVYYTRNKYSFSISASDNVTLDKTYSGTYKYGYSFASVTATFNEYIGYEWVGWRKDGVSFTEDQVVTFTVVCDVSYVATAKLKAEYEPFDFTSTATSCTINGIKDKTVTEIVIPDGVTSIGGYAFYGCSSLTSVVWNATNCTIAGSYNYPIFSNCTNLTTINIGENVTNIPAYAFYNCSSLTSVTIGNGVTSIGNYAFYNCSSLTSVTIPDGVKRIGGWAFYNCSSLTSVTIPDGVFLIDQNAFSGCSSLTSVTIGNSVTSIGGSAFSRCYKLVEVYNKSQLNITKGSKDNGYVGYYAKDIYTSEYVSKLSTDENGYILYTDGDDRILIGYTGDQTQLTLPDSITEINQYAFYYCSSLTSVTIPDGVTSIGEWAFSDCSSLTSVTIGSGVTSIGNGAFYDCSSLTSVTIPDSVTSIGYSAFRYCSSLTSVTIPDSVTSIGDYAFYRCDSLTSIKFNGTKAQWQAISKGNDWKYNVPSTCVVRCDDGDLSI